MIINLTPHAIRIRIDASGNAVDLDSDVVIQPSGTVARVSSMSVDTDVDVDGIPSYQTIYGDVQDLPDPVQGTTYIVSTLVLSRIADRTDLRSPLTDRTAIRDGAGHIFAVRGLQE